MLAELVADADVHTVIVRHGIVVHAAGRLDLGRSTRIANRAQRRVLRGLYPTCAIPGCAIRYEHCDLHHIVWWRHGGATDLANLLPLCSRHHHDIHDNNWQLSLTRRPHPHHQPPRRTTNDHRTTQTQRRMNAGTDARSDHRDHAGRSGRAPSSRSRRRDRVTGGTTHRASHRSRSCAKVAT